MRTPTFAFLILSLSAPSLPAQKEILYYKFDETGGTKVVNFTPPTSPAPREGTLVTTDVTGFAPGRFGAGALRGATSSSIRSHIDSGWDGTFSGDFTIAWWMRQRTAPSGTSYVFDLGNLPSSQQSFRCFTGGVASRGLYLRWWGGTPTDLTLGYDLQTAAAAVWVHVAIVVDSTAGTAIWYIDGKAHTTIPITGSANVVTGTQNFFVGFYTQFTGPTYYDMDEFRFLNRAAVMPEILAWSLIAPGAEGSFGKGCGHTLAGAGTRPSIGNSSYALTLAGAPGAGLLAIGRNRSSLSGIPLPIDLGLAIPGLGGCLFHSSMDLTLAVVPGNIPLPIPGDSFLLGVGLYCQAVLVTPTHTGWSSSNALALSIGN